jgi:hypothetical protein
MSALFLSNTSTHAMQFSRAAYSSGVNPPLSRFLGRPSAVT